MTDFPLPYLSEKPKRWLSIQSFDAQLKGSRKVRCRQHLNSFNHNYAYPCLLESSCLKIWRQLGISASCLFCIIFSSNLSGLGFSMQQLQQHFLSCDTVHKFFWGLSLFKHHYPGCTTDRESRFYTYGIRILHQAIVVSGGCIPGLVWADSYGHHPTVGLHQRLACYDGELKAWQEHQQGSRQ